MKIEKLYISEERSVLEAMKQLDEAARQILYITENEKLKAVITDGDIRRHLLHGGKLEQQVKEIANYNPRFIYERDKDKSHKLMQEWAILSLPIVNEKMEIQSIVFLKDHEIGRERSINIPVVIMAGGLGTRLYPYTKVLPKPLIPIGEIPISEHIIRNFTEYNCNEFHMIVNHKKNMIKAYFSEVEKNYIMEFHDEEIPLGTGGGLSLLKDKIDKTFFFTNCDILIRANYKEIFDYHVQNQNMITIVAAYKHFTIPYGIINLDCNAEMDTMTEKPEYSFLINTGFYLVEPMVLSSLREDQPLSFPDIIEQRKSLGEKIGVFPVSEKSWLDMGQFEELEEMRKELGG